MKIYGTRHGETDYNVKELNMGRRDIPLNGKGLKQALTLSKNLKGMGVKSVVCSPLVRAITTAEIASELPHLVIPEFIEVDWGHATGRARVDGHKNLIAWRSGFYLPAGSETFLEVRKRVRKGLKKVRNLPGPVLIISHLGTHWAIEAELGLPFTDLLNCGIRCYEDK